MNQTQAEPEVITFDGRSFYDPDAGERTAENDSFCVSKHYQAGLVELESRPREGESHELYSRRLLANAMNHGVIYELLGGMWLPVGTKPTEWTPELALETAAFLKHLTGADKAALFGRIAGVVARFFSAGLTSFASSPSSSDRSQPDPNDQIEAAVATESGGPSSEPSLTTTSIGVSG